MSAFESLYDGQFALSTQLIKPNYLVILPTNAAPQFVRDFPLYCFKFKLAKTSFNVQLLYKLLIKWKLNGGGGLASAHVE